MALDKDNLDKALILQFKAGMRGEGPLQERVQKEYAAAYATEQALAKMSGQPISDVQLHNKTWDRVCKDGLKNLNDEMCTALSDGASSITGLKGDQMEKALGVGQGLWGGNIIGSVFALFTQLGGYVRKVCTTFTECNAPGSTRTFGEVWKDQNQKEELGDWAGKLGINTSTGQKAFVASLVAPVPADADLTIRPPYMAESAPQQTTQAPAANAAPAAAPQAQPPAASKNNTEAAEKARIAQAKAAKEKVVADAQGVTHDDSACSVYLPLTGKTVKTHAKGCSTT